MAEIRFDRVRKAYGDNVVVEQLDLTIGAGEFVVLVGPSGCGKSTILRMIAGLEPITSGDLYIDGKRVNDLSPRDRDIAMVFQSYALYPHMTVRENMAFGLKVRGTPRREIARAVDEVAQMLGLGELLDRKPAQLSGGQRQRVAMGRAIVRRPKAFLFDEPLSNLDAKLRSEVRAEIARLRRRLATTTVYVTHDQVEAMTLADRVVVLDSGRVQQVGPPLEVYRRPANTFVAGFLGTPTMNFVDVEVRSGRAVAPWGEMDLEVPEATRTIGVRPQDLVVGGEGVLVARAEVDVVERLGSESYALARCQGVRLTALVPDGGDVEQGAKAPLCATPESVHLFDGEGRRIEVTA